MIQMLYEYTTKIYLNSKLENHLTKFMRYFLNFLRKFSLKLKDVNIYHVPVCTINVKFLVVFWKKVPISVIHTAGEKVKWQLRISKITSLW